MKRISITTITTTIIITTGNGAGLNAYRKKKKPALNSAGFFFRLKDHEVTTMRVLKFGGTSVANAERFLRVADILESNARQGQVATVLSAPAKITNHLVAMIEKTIGGAGCTGEHQRRRADLR